MTIIMIHIMMIIMIINYEAGVDPGRVKLAVTWSFAMRTSLIVQYYYYYY